MLLNKLDMSKITDVQKTPHILLTWTMYGMYIMSNLEKTNYVIYCTAYRWVSARKT